MTFLFLLLRFMLIIYSSILFLGLIIYQKNQFKYCLFLQIYAYHVIHIWSKMYNKIHININLMGMYRIVGTNLFIKCTKQRICLFFKIYQMIDGYMRYLQNSSSLTIGHTRLNPIGLLIKHAQAHQLTFVIIVLHVPMTLTNSIQIPSLVSN